MDKKTKSLSFNALIGLVTVFVGLIYGIMTLLTPRSVIGKPMAPLYFPLGLAALLILLGIILFIKSDFSKSIMALKDMKNQGNEEKISKKLILLTCIAAIFYAATFNKLGYVISTFIFMEIMLLLTNGKKKWVLNTIISLCFSVGIYIIFSKLLGVILPPMPFV